MTASACKVASFSKKNRLRAGFGKHWANRSGMFSTSGRDQTWSTVNIVESRSILRVGIGFHVGT